MKKKMVLMLVFAMLTGAMAGCGQDQSVKGDAPASDTAQAEAEASTETETQAEASEEAAAFEAASEETAAQAEASEADEADEENYDTGDAKLDDPGNQSEGIGEKELLVVSFGTSFNDSRRLTIGAIEDAFEKKGGVGGFFSKLFG